SKSASFYLMCKIDNRVIFDLEIDQNGRTAKFGMCLRRSIGCFQPPDPLNISGKTKNFRVVDVVQHRISVLPQPKHIKVASAPSLLLQATYIMVAVGLRQGMMPLWVPVSRTPLSGRAEIFLQYPLDKAVNRSTRPCRDRDYG